MPIIGATLLRNPSTEQGTFGVFKTDDGMHEWYSLELPWIDKNMDGIGDPQRSCITPGVYTCVWHESPSKGWLYEVRNVLQRTNILIHSANFAGDIDHGWESQLLGCIAIGKSRGKLTNSKGVSQDAILSSRRAIQELFDWGGKQPFTLQIIEAG